MRIAVPKTVTVPYRDDRGRIQKNPQSVVTAGFPLLETKKKRGRKEVEGVGHGIPPTSMGIIPGVFERPVYGV